MWVKLNWKSATAVARYEPEVVQDGVANQLHNPEVEVDVRKTSTIINQEMLKLKLVTAKLKNAYNGVEVDWIDFQGKQQNCLQNLYVFYSLFYCEIIFKFWCTICNFFISKMFDLQQHLDMLLFTHWLIFVNTNLFIIMITLINVKHFYEKIQSFLKIEKHIT